MSILVRSQMSRVVPPHLELCAASVRDTSPLYRIDEVSTGASVDRTVLRLKVVWSWRVLFLGDDDRLVTSRVFPQQYLVSD